MDEIIVRATRAMASYPRLRILSLLAQGEQTPTRMAKTLQLPLCAISLHLRVLVNADLITRRKSGTWCYYRAESPYDATAFSGKLAQWLYALLKTSSAGDSNHSGLLKVRNGSTGPGEESHRILFEAATAFTDLRRLQLLRHLGRQQNAGAQALEENLSMSPQAVTRHMGKLMRRGYVQAQHLGRSVVYEPKRTAKTPVHRRLFEIIGSTWEGSFRTL